MRSERTIAEKNERRRAQCSKYAVVQPTTMWQTAISFKDQSHCHPCPSFIPVSHMITAVLKLPSSVTAESDAYFPFIGKSRQLDVQSVYAFVKSQVRREEE
jgi:hypothetical protein